MSPRIIPSKLPRATELFLVLTLVSLAAEPGPAEPATAMPSVQSSEPAQLPQTLTVSDAVRWALGHNPDIATTRQQHGIAAAGVITARTYPFNPLAQSYVWGDNGPASAQVTNHVFNEHIVRLEIEMRGQGKYRRAAACAALNRTDWEIATQEVALAIRVIRACDTFAYRREKLLLVDEGIQQLQQNTEQLSKLVEQGKANRTQLLLSQADIAGASSAIRAPVYSQYETAWYDLRRLLGLVSEPLEGISDTLEPIPLPENADLISVALERRPEIHALDLAVKEADARLQLEVANRYGNPSFGPAFEYNETSAYFIGGVAYFPIPVLNTHHGEILQRKAERVRATAALNAAEMHVRQDVQAALRRIDNAAEAVNAYRTKTLPALQEASRGINQLFAQGEPGVDVTSVNEVRRRILAARGGYLDALYELSQARADLAAAIGDPSLAFVNPAPPK